MTPRLAFAAWLIAVVPVACQAPTGSVVDAQMELGAANATNLTLEIVVNGTKVADLAAGAQLELTAGQLPPLPWMAEVRLPSGRSLVSLTVRSGDVQSAGNAQRGDSARIDLSCGRIDIWSGPSPIGPIPAAGASGDCDP